LYKFIIIIYIDKINSRSISRPKDTKNEKNGGNKEKILFKSLSKQSLNKQNLSKNSLKSCNSNKNFNTIIKRK